MGIHRFCENNHSLKTTHLILNRTYAKKTMGILLDNLVALLCKFNSFYKSANIKPIFRYLTESNGTIFANYFYLSLRK